MITQDTNNVEHAGDAKTVTNAYAKKMKNKNKVLGSYKWCPQGCGKIRASHIRGDDGSRLWICNTCKGSLTTKNLINHWDKMYTQIM